MNKDEIKGKILELVKSDPTGYGVTLPQIRKVLGDAFSGNCYIQYSPYNPTLIIWTRISSDVAMAICELVDKTEESGVFMWKDYHPSVDILALYQSEGTMLDMPVYAKNVHLVRSRRWVPVVFRSKSQHPISWGLLGYALWPVRTADGTPEKIRYEKEVK